MLQYFTPAWTSSVYAIICAAVWVCIWRIYPETKGLGLEDVSSLLHRGWGVKESLQRTGTG